MSFLELVVEGESYLRRTEWVFLCFVLAGTLLLISPEHVQMITALSLPILLYSFEASLLYPFA